MFFYLARRFQDKGESVIGDECQAFEDRLSLIALDIICLLPGGGAATRSNERQLILVNTIRTLEY